MKGLFYDHIVQINSRDVDGRGHCRPSALLGHLQEAATLAAERGGFGRDRLLQECDGFWMLARLWYRLERPLHWDETITIRTWHRGARTALMYRDFDIWAGEEKVGEAVSGWVLADMSTRKLLRLGSISVLENTDGGELCKDIILSKLRLPKEMEQVERRKMRYSDTDINDHVNNTRYADFACDVLGMEQLPEGMFLASMQLGYTAECRAGEEVILLKSGGGPEYYVKGVDDAGKPRFEVQAAFASMKD